MIAKSKRHSVRFDKTKKHENLLKISCKKNGKTYSISISPIEAGEVKKDFFMIIIEDTTKIIRVQELQEIIQYKNKTLNSVSHELRTPLNGSIVILDLALRSQELLNTKFRNSTILPAWSSCKLLLSMINCIIDNNQIECTNFSYFFK